MEFKISVDHRVKIKENEKRDKYLNLARKLEQNIIGVLEKVPKGLEKGPKELQIEGQAESIQTRALLRSARILKRVLDIWRNLLSLRLQWKFIS